MLLMAATTVAQTIVNGIPWYDQNREPVSAHGANIIRDGGKYYLFGEYKTDSANVFMGFSCYSSENLSDWSFEGIAFNQQTDGRMGPKRVGERPKVLRCPKTGEYVMLMHTDNMQYKDPCTCYATSRNITGPYEFQGPLLYKGQPVKKWDIGSFMDDDGHGYLLVHHGMIYRLAPDFHSLDSCLMNGVKGSGESPAMMKKDGIYYWISSHTTSWERNDNMYWTATSLGGPWTYGGEFCPKGSLTWNSQCSFLLPLDNGRWMYMGDRWSFPRQRQAATYVWLPIEAHNGVLSIDEYWEQWNPQTGKQVSPSYHTVGKQWKSDRVGETFIYKYEGTQIGLLGNTDDMSGYADISIKDKADKVVFQTSVDFYSLVPATGLRWLSPRLPMGKYTLEVRVSEMKPNWSDKSRRHYGSKGHKVEITDVIIEKPLAGPQYMPAEMEPVVAPFDVSGIHLPEFVNRSTTVKMAKRGLSTRAIQKAIDRMSLKGGGTVIIPDGEWLSGRIILKTGVRLHLSDGAVLKFSGDIKDYQPAVPTRNEGYDVMSLGAMIYANGAENIGVTGRGHIVGPSTDCEMYQKNRNYLVVEECIDITKPVAERLCDGQEGRPVLLPMMLAPVNSKNILIEGVTIDQGLFWNIVPQYCDNVIIRGVTVNSAGHGRTDGIDIESTTNALIEYCSLDCGDDCYTIKSGRGEDGVKTGRPSVNVVIRHSIALRGGGGLVLGSETAANMWNIYMHDCVMDGTQQAFRFKSRRPRGGGGHGIWVERVYARNITYNAFAVDMLGSKKWVGELANRYPAREINELTPEFKNIHIKDITIDGCARFIDVKALPERPLTNVVIENVDVRCKDFMRMQDANEFVLRNAAVHTSQPTANVDGCKDVRLFDVSFDGKELKRNLKNATFYLSSTEQTAQQRDCLYQSFLTPPDSIRVGCYYYWVNEQVDPKGVRADLQWMKDNGITLAFLATDIRNRTSWENPWAGQTFGKNKYMSRLWWENLRTALKTAGELDIEMGLFNCPGWSQSGGPWIKPEEAMRNWTPDGIKVCQTVRGTDVTNGPCSDEAEGLEVDKLSKAHVKKHFEAFIGEILRRIPAQERKTLTTVVIDSWERGKQNYTDSIYDKFRQHYGYELDYTNDACRRDLDRLISDLVATEYMGGLTEKAHEYGLRTWCEPYAHSPFPGNSITYGSQADEVAAEFWVNDRKFRQKEVDAALGAARSSGKNKVWAESLTDGAWDKPAQDDWSFEKLKPIADRYFHAGINATILHVMISQPGDDSMPAVRPWFGTFFDRRSQHAADLKPLVQYLRRCNYMLQLGKPYNSATDQRILDDGTIIRFTDDSQFELTFPDGHKEAWNPCK